MYVCREKMKDLSYINSALNMQVYLKLVCVYIIIINVFVNC